MNMELLGALSERFFYEIGAVMQRALMVTNTRGQISVAGCNHSNEHWFAIRCELDNELLSAAVFSHRAQRRALIRAIWHYFKADEQELAQLNPNYSLEDDCQLAMMAPIDTVMTWVASYRLKDGDSAVEHMRHDVSEWFRQSIIERWQPLPRHDEDYPMTSMVALQRDANGLLLMAMMHTFMLNKDLGMERDLVHLAVKFKECLPTPLAEKSARWS